MNMLDQVIEDGRLVRKAWSHVEDGRQLLCLYTALAGDPDARPETCPASLCQKWLAYLLPWMDDNGTQEAWPAMVLRVAKLAPKFATLPASLQWQVRALCVREAMRHTDDENVLSICNRVIELCERRWRGGDVPEVEFVEARRAAAAAAWSAGAVSAAAAWAADEEVEAAAAWSAVAAWEAAGSSAREVTVDRLTTAILDAIEAA